MKGLEDFISRTRLRHGWPTFGIRNRRFGPRAAGAPRPRQREHSSARPQEATTRISVTSSKDTIGSRRTQKSSVRIDPGTEVRNEDQPERKRPASRAPKNAAYQPTGPAYARYHTTRQQGLGESGREIRDDDREGAGTFRHACFIRMSCRGLYLNPGYQPSAHRFPTRLPEEPNPGRGEARPGNRTGRQ